MELSKLINILELEFPPETAWRDDSIGLQIKSSKSEIRNVYLTLELNNKSIDEAVAHSSDLIITFHPLIFSPLSSINIDDRVGKLVTQIISNDINLYSIHTNFDSHSRGTSYELCRMLGFTKSEYLVQDINYEDKGMGAIIDLDEPINFKQLLDKVSTVCCSPLKYNKPTSDNVSRIAILGGSGSSYVESAINKECDVIITADIKYHDFHSAANKIAIIDPGHYEMEQFVSNAMYNILNEKLKNELCLTRGSIVTNPVHYYPKNNYSEMQKNYLNNN